MFFFLLKFSGCLKNSNLKNIFPLKPLQTKLLHQIPLYQSSLHKARVKQFFRRDFRLHILQKRIHASQMRFFQQFNQQFAIRLKWKRLKINAFFLPIGVDNGAVSLVIRPLN